MSQFGPPSLLADVNTIAMDHHPALSSDGLRLVMSSNRGGGVGDTDIWIATRPSSAAAFAPATNWAELKSSAEDSSAMFSSDELTVVFVSERPGGVGGKDLWIATRTSLQSPFGAPTNLTAINSTTTDSDCALSADSLEIVFSSPRDGTRTLWRSARTCQ